MPGNFDGKISAIETFLWKFIVTIVTIKPLNFFAISYIRKTLQRNSLANEIKFTAIEICLDTYT